MILKVSKKRIASLTLILFFTAKVMDGPIRYYLDNLGLVLLTYVPTFLLIGVSFCFLFLKPPVPVKLYSFIAFFFIIGIIYVGNVFQVLFGLYLLTPFIAGYTLYEYTPPKLFIIIWLITAIGILINYYTPFEWEGYSYSVGNVDVVANLKWFTKDKVDRLSGFCRASYEAAIFLVFSGTYLILQTDKSIFKFIIWLITGFCIILTTTKGIIFAFLIATIFMLFNWQKKKIGKIMILFIVIIGIYFPFSTLLIKYTIDFNSDISLILFASFEDRLTISWPEVFKIIFEKGSLIWGRGFGGIGTPMYYFEPNINLWIYPDNGYLDIYANFGIIGIIILLVSVFRAFKNNKNMYIFTLLIVSFAVTNNFLTDSFIGFLIGGILQRNSNQIILLDERYKYLIMRRLR